MRGCGKILTNQLAPRYWAAYSLWQAIEDPDAARRHRSLICAKK